jgi:riboflavin kinase
MVMSIGFNPYYNNETRTAEVHILHEYKGDFYGKELRTVILGFVRPEYNYASLGTSISLLLPPLCSYMGSVILKIWCETDALIKDIEMDKQVAAKSVARPAYQKYIQDSFFTKPSVLAPPTRDPLAPKEKPNEKEKED